MLKYLLIGRIGSGREFFQKLLVDKGLTVAKSFTTRGKRNDADNMHYFIDETNAETYPHKLFETIHNGVHYFYTEDEIDNADVIPIDPENVKTICDAYPDTVFRLIEIMAANDERIKHSVTDADDKLIAEEEFIAACEEENDAFCALEDAMTTSKLDISNMSIGYMLTNDFTKHSGIYGWPEVIIKAKRVFGKMLKIISELPDGTLLYDNETNKYGLWTTNTETKIESMSWVSPGIMAEQSLVDPEGMKRVMTEWLALERDI